MQLADPPGDEVAVLGPEVQDGDLGSRGSSGNSNSGGGSHNKSATCAGSSAHEQ